ncbi:MAG TPA: DUF4335 domain-containing protein, partial [Candidatus Obscuribacterales bacterium]
MTLTTPLTPYRSDSPTVTLEVMARVAAVSQWSERPVVEVWRYHLHLRQGEDDSLVEIRGDRASFLPLVAAVQDYIQAQLAQTALPGDRPPDLPYLVPRGLTQHQLHLGSLQTTTGATSLTLGIAQLADLGDVFAQLEAQVRPLPVSLRPERRQRPWRQWGTAAAGIVAAVGLTTVLWPTYDAQRELGDTALEAPPTTTESVPAPSAADRQGRSPQTAPDSPPPADPAEADSAAENRPAPPPTAPPAPTTALDPEAGTAKNGAPPPPTNGAAPPTVQQRSPAPADQGT